LDGGSLPVGGADENAEDGVTPVEVTVTDASSATPIKKPSLGRSHRIGGSRPTGLQRHLKRDSVQQGDSGSMTTDVADKDAAAVAAANLRGSSSGGRFGVTLVDGPTRE
jgi:hypothetical protein